MDAKNRRVLCFPPLETVERHTAQSEIPVGWTICRGSYYVTEYEAVAMMSGALKPITSGDARRPVYRCPRVATKIVYI